MPSGKSDVPPLSLLFPAGGPVRPELVVGRVDEVDAIVARLREGVHTMLVGPRRIGKTTVCDKVCAELASTHAVIRIEVPERESAEDLLRQFVQRTAALSLSDELRAGFRAARPLLGKLLSSEGIDLDLSEFGEDKQLSVREVLGLPREIAVRSGKPIVLFLDEVQRIVSYTDGEQLLIDLADIYSGQQDVAVLVDGSEERALEAMLGPPIGFGKLCRRRDLSPTIPRSIWRDALRQRFAEAGLEIEPGALEQLLDFGNERPYPTMTLAQDCALIARQMTSSGAVGQFEVSVAITESKKRLGDDQN